MTDRDPHEEDQRGDDPVILRAEGERIMVRKHQEQHGQRQIVVVRRTLLRLFSERRIGRTACDQVGNDFLLVRDDEQNTLADMMVAVKAPRWEDRPPGP